MDKLNSTLDAVIKFEAKRNRNSPKGNRNQQRSARGGNDKSKQQRSTRRRGGRNGTGPATGSQDVNGRPSAASQPSRVANRNSRRRGKRRQRSSPSTGSVTPISKPLRASGQGNTGIKAPTQGNSAVRAATQGNRTAGKRRAQLRVQNSHPTPSVPSRPSVSSRRRASRLRQARSQPNLSLNRRRNAVPISAQQRLQQSSEGIDDGRALSTPPQRGISKKRRSRRRRSAQGSPLPPQSSVGRKPFGLRIRSRQQTQLGRRASRRM